MGGLSPAPLAFPNAVRNGESEAGALRRVVCGSAGGRVCAQVMRLGVGLNPGFAKRIKIYANVVYDTPGNFTLRVLEWDVLWGWVAVLGCTVVVWACRGLFIAVQSVAKPFLLAGWPQSLSVSSDLPSGQ